MVAVSQEWQLAHIVQLDICFCNLFISNYGIDAAFGVPAIGDTPKTGVAGQQVGIGHPHNGVAPTPRESAVRSAAEKPSQESLY